MNAQEIVSALQKDHIGAAFTSHVKQSDVEKSLALEGLLTLLAEEGCLETWSLRWCICSATSTLE